MLEVVVRPILMVGLFFVQDVLGYLTGRSLLALIPTRLVVATTFAQLADAPLRIWRREGDTYVVSGWVVILIGHAFWALAIVALIAIASAR